MVLLGSPEIAAPHLMRLAAGILGDVAAMDAAPLEAGGFADELEFRSCREADLRVFGFVAHIKLSSSLPLAAALQNFSTAISGLVGMRTM